MKAKHVVVALSALAQESRLAAYRALVEAGRAGLSAGKIGERTGISPSSLSFHLKELSHAGLVSARPEGRFIFYTANFAAINELLSFLTENCCGGDSCATDPDPECCTTEERTS